MIPKLNILFLPEWYPGLVDRQNGVFVEKHAHAVSQYHNVVVIYVAAVSGLEEKYTIEVSGKNPFVIRSYYRPSVFRPFSFFRYKKACKQAVKKLPALSFNLVHLHVTGRNYFAWKMFFSHLPYVITEHWSGFSGEKSSRTLISATFTKKAFDGALRISAVSRNLKNSLEKNWNLSNIEVIPNIIEKSIGEAPKPSDKRVRILCVADLYDENKNISGIIQSVHNIKSPYPFRLTIIGDGPSRKKLEQLAAEKKLLDETVFFMGAKTNSEVLDEMRKSDFLVMNSRKETFSMVCAESIYSGKPVIATRCGGPEEFVNEQNGILIDVDSTDQLQTAIEKMIVSYHQYDSTKIAEEMKEKFGIKHVTFLLEEFYFSALGSKKAKSGK